jgi:outer membrane protein OmpA-like peptidoglycan-associated protein
MIQKLACIAVLWAVITPVGAQGALRIASVSARALARELDSDEALLRTKFEGLPADTNVVLVRDPQHLTLRIPARVLFDADSAQANHDAIKGQPWLAVTQLLRKRHRLVAQINVYTDSIGGQAANHGFSEQRALSLVAALHAAAIRPDRVAARGLGASAELAGDDSPEGREQNRRVEVVLGFGMP